MNVFIIDTEQNNKRIAEIPIKIQGLSYIPQANEYFEIAWRIAVDQGIVMNENKSKYLFSF